jgi:hypothetical protein
MSSLRGSARITDPTEFSVRVGPGPASPNDPSYAALTLFDSSDRGFYITAEDPEVFDALAVSAAQARDQLIEQIQRRQI